MPIRDPKQAAEELAIFNAFLTAYPSFASKVTDIEQPDVEFPDIIAKLDGGGQIDFELGRWLHTEQTAQSKNRMRLSEAIDDAIGEQGENQSKHFDLVLLFPRSPFPRFSKGDAQTFRKDIWSLIQDTESRWSNERFWHSPQGRHVNEFETYPTLGKYVSKVIFDPKFVAGKRQGPYPSGVSWIAIPAPVSSYSSDSALGALENILAQKTEAYGVFSRPTHLIIYYAEAVMHNTPWYGIQYRQFSDVAKVAGQKVAHQTAFEKMYLFSALEPGLEAYEIFPGFAKLE